MRGFFSPRPRVAHATTCADPHEIGSRCPQEARTSREISPRKRPETTATKPPNRVGRPKLLASPCKTLAPDPQQNCSHNGLSLGLHGIIIIDHHQPPRSASITPGLYVSRIRGPGRSASIRSARGTRGSRARVQLSDLLTSLHLHRRGAYGCADQITGPQRSKRAKRRSAAVET